MVNHIYILPTLLGVDYISYSLLCPTVAKYIFGDRIVKWTSNVANNMDNWTVNIHSAVCATPQHKCTCEFLQYMYIREFVAVMQDANKIDLHICCNVFAEL